MDTQTVSFNGFYLFVFWCCSRVLMLLCFLIYFQISRKEKMWCKKPFVLCVSAPRWGGTEDLHDGSCAKFNFCVHGIIGTLMVAGWQVKEIDDSVFFFRSWNPRSNSNSQNENLCDNRRIWSKNVELASAIFFYNGIDGIFLTCTLVENLKALVDLVRAVAYSVIS